MKQVMILRHGKSNWRAAFDTDHERPLAKRGRLAAVRMGRFLQLSGEPPQRVVTSTARRALHTAELAREAGDWNCPIDAEGALYDATVAAALQIVQTQSDDIFRLLLVGHQPTLSELLVALTGGGSVRFPTAALARIDFSVDRWCDVRLAEGRLIWLVTPKLLQRAELGD